MAKRENYTVLIPFPKGDGHWATKGEKLDLLEVEAGQLRRAGRVKRTADIQAAAQAPAIKPTKAKD